MTDFLASVNTPLHSTVCCVGTQGVVTLNKARS